MRRRVFRFAEIALAALLVAGAEGAAEAQPCCAGASALTPARLALYEDALVGVAPRFTEVFGAFDDHQRFAAQPSGSNEIDLEQDLVGTIRFLKRAQASVLIPFDETYRVVPGRDEWGGGFGDLELALRYDFLEAGQSKTIPGIAIVASSTLPTGRPTEDSSPLLTSATGTGALQLSVGASVEQTFGPWLVDVTGSTTWRAPRTVGTVHEQLGELFAVSSALAYSFERGLVLAASVAYSAEFAPVENGKTVNDGGRSFLRAGLSAGVPFADHYRAQGTFFTDLPIRGLGQNENTGLGVSFIFIRSWTWS